jgi:polyphenol oxidase
MKASVGSGLFRKNDNGIYRCVPFEEFTWLDHGFSTRHTTHALRPITTLRQIHSALVRDARGLADRCLEGDALVSDEPGTAIGIRTADCVPILLVDTATRAVAAVHAGWRGTAAKIIHRALETMSNLFQTNPRDIRAAIGPAIGVCCYQVGLEVAARFKDLYPELLPDGNDHTMLNLPDANRKLLLAAGVPAIQIYNSRLCTFCNPEEFFSYRRDSDDPGRLLSSICREA